MRLAAALGDLPLALDQAGAYCKLTGTSFDAYRGKIGALIDKAPKGATHPSVFATFDLAIEKAAAENAAAETLLSFFAFLAPENIPLDLVNDDIVPAADLPEALAALASVSLIEHVRLDDGLPAETLHRLVQAAMRERLTERGETSAAIDRATRRLANAFPSMGYSEPKSWPRCASLLPHVLGLREQGGSMNESAAAATNLLNSAGLYLQRRAAYSEAEPLLRETLTIGEKAFGHKSLRVSAYLNNLGNLLQESDRPAEAEPLLREAIAIGEREFGREHQTVAGRLHNLAKALRVAGRYAEAESLFREAITIGEKTLGREHPDVAVFIGSFGNFLARTGHYAEAELLLNEAHAIHSKMLGTDDPRTAMHQWSLAALYRLTGRTAEALPHAEAGLRAFDKTFGQEHPRTKQCAVTYVAILDDLDRKNEAAEVRAKYDIAQGFESSAKIPE